MKIRNRSRRKFLVVSAVATTLVVAAACLWVGKMQARHEVFGGIDPASGFRCRYTVGAGWGANVGQIGSGSAASWKLEHFASGKSYWILDANWFDAPRPSPLQEWIDSHSGKRAYQGPRSINQDTLRANDMAKLFPIRDGYPEPVLKPQAHILSHRHFRVDGCPATVVDAEMLNGESERTMIVCIYVPAPALLYELQFRGAPMSESAPLDRELQAILASFHVEKIALPIAGKR